MNELITIKKDESGTPVVDARELHEFLGVGKRFTTWIQERIEGYGFREDEDFLPVLGESQFGRPTKEYLLTMDMAKELCMVEKNQRGHDARQYFLDVERELYRRQVVPQSFSEALQLAADQARRIEEQQPAVEFHLAVTDSKDALCMGDVAKILDVGLGRNQLFSFLRDHGVLDDHNVPYQRYIDSGWFRLVEMKRQDSLGNIRVFSKTLVYQKGVDGIFKLLKDAGYSSKEPRPQRKYRRVKKRSTSSIGERSES